MESESTEALKTELPLRAAGKPLKRRLSLFTRLMISFVLIATIPIIAFSVYTVTTEHRIMADRKIIELKASSSKLAARIDKYLAVHRNLVQQYTRLSEMNSFLVKGKNDPARIKALNSWLDLQTAMNPEYSAFYLMDTTGLCLVSSDRTFIGNNYRVRSYFKESMKGKAFASDWSIGLTSKEPGVYFSAPVFRDPAKESSEILGIAVLKLRVTEMANRVEQMKIGEQDAFIINKDGIILTHTRPELAYHSLVPLSSAQLAEIASTRQFVEKPIEPLDLGEVYSAFRQSISSRSVQVAHYVFKAQKTAKYAAMAPLTEKNWVAGVAVPEKEIFVGITHIIHTTAIFALIAIIISIGGSYVLSRSIAEPIRRLTAAVDTFAEDGTVPAWDDSGGEVGSLARSFNRMAVMVVEHRTGLQRMVDERTSELRSLNEKLHELSVHDELTDCFNRRYFVDNLGKEITRLRRYGGPLSIVMCDLDNFKKINDKHGHAKGDLVLKEFSSILIRSTRKDIDWAVRYGGEEFLIVLPNTPMKGAVAVAERFRTSTETKVFISPDDNLRVTASFGVLSMEPSADKGTLTIDSIVSKVDELLYRAKNEGRNRVVAEEFHQKTV